MQPFIEILDSYPYSKNIAVTHQYIDDFFQPFPDELIIKTRDYLQIIVDKSIEEAGLSLLKGAQVVPFGSSMRKTIVPGEVDFDFSIHLNPRSADQLMNDDNLSERFKYVLTQKAAIDGFSV